MCPRVSHFTYANLLSSNITQHDEFIKAPFPAKNLLKQKKCLPLEAKTLPISLRA